MVRNIVFRGTLAGTACVAATVSGLVLRSTLGALTFPPAPFLSPTGSGRGKIWRGSERILATSYAMVARVRYVPDEQSGCLIRLANGTQYRCRCCGARLAPSPSPQPPSAPPRGTEGGRYGAGAKEYWQPPTQWSHGYGTCPIERF